MKRLLPLLLLALSALLVPLHAQSHVTDSINLLKGRAGQLSSELSSSPVWIETFEGVPSGDLKTYSDSRAAQLCAPNKGFLVVITTNPRAWRISMYPVGFVGADTTRGIGEEMGAGFKTGDFYGALSKASRKLAGVAAGTTVVHSARTPDGGTKVVTTSSSTTVSSKLVKVAPATVTIQRAPTDWTWLWVITGSIILIVLIFVFLDLWSTRQTRKERREQEAHDERMAAMAAKRPVVISSTSNTPPTPEQREKAQQSWDSYTPAQRQTVVNQYAGSPHYHPGVLSDPLSFFMFMSLMNHGGFGHSHYGYGGGGYGYAPAAPVVVETQPFYVEERTERVERTEETTYVPPSRQSDDDSSSSYRRRDDDAGSSSSWSDSSSSSGSSDSSSSSSSDSGSSGDSGSW